MVKIGVRLATLLKRNGLTLEQAFDKSDRELLSMRNFGTKTLKVLRDIQTRTFTSDNYHEYLEDCKAIGWLPPHER